MTRPKWWPFHAMIMTFPWHDYDYFTLQILFFAWQNLYFWRISGFWVTSSLELGRGLEGSYRILKDLSRILKDISRILKDLVWFWRNLKDPVQPWRVCRDLEWSFRILKGLVGSAKWLNRSMNSQKCEWVTDWVCEWVTRPDLERLAPLKINKIGKFQKLS